MPKVCAVPSCRKTSKQDGKRSFFRAPKIEESRRKWVIPGLKLLKSSQHVCERHFQPGCIVRKLVKRGPDGNILIDITYKRPRLLESAVPSIFEFGCPAHEDADNKNENIELQCGEEEEFCVDIPDASRCSQPSLSFSFLPGDPVEDPTKRCCFREDKQKRMSHCLEDKSHHGAAEKASKSFILQEMRLQDEEDSEPILILIEDEPLEISTTGDSEDETQKFEPGLSENRHEVECKRRKVSEKGRHIECLSKLVSHLKVLDLLSEEHATILLDNFGNDRDMFRRIFSKSLLKSSKEIEISHKYFATTFQFLSPASYQYVRKNYQCHLLNVPNLSSWYCSSEGRPGFSSEAFEFLKRAQKKLVCSLLYGEMPVRQYEEIYQGQYYGYVDFGCPILGDCMPTAKKVLVFLLVCLNDTWKLPLGYFFIADITSEQKKSLVTMCLALLERSKVRVTNLTFDESSLECFKSWCIGEYFVTPDPASMVTSIKNHVRDKGLLISSRGTIHSKYLKQPYNYQEEKDKTGNTSTTEEANYESLGDSITDALLVFNNVDYAKEFRTADATLDFILSLNEVLSIFNSREIGDSSDLEWTIKKVLDFYHYFESYLNDLKYPDGTQVIQMNKAVGLTGLLKGLYAILTIYKIYVKELKLLPSIPVYKWSLDHINRFFSLFKLPDLDEYPTCRQFSAMYKHIVLNDEMDDTVTVNCIPIESVGIVDLSIDKENSVFEIVNEHDYIDLT